MLTKLYSILLYYILFLESKYSLYAMHMHVENGDPCAAWALSTNGDEVLCSFNEILAHKANVIGV